MYHVPPQLNEDRLHCEVSLPLYKTRQFARIHLSITGVYAGEVNLGEERDIGRYVRIRFAAMYLQTVDSVLVYAVRRAQNSTVPIGHEEIVTIVQTV